jgi:(p)ppGpp synthase/HD superfamily hydrolase
VVNSLDHADVNPPAAKFFLQFAESNRVHSLVTRSWIPTFPPRLPLTRSAVEYADRMHAGQRRGDGTPFILHPLEVASLLYRSGAPDHLIAAGVMHDVVEKTDANASDLRERFGPASTDLVLAVTEDDRIPGHEQRKAALRCQVADAGEEALTLFAADKLSKLRELRRETAADPRSTNTRVQESRVRRLMHYTRSLALLEERLAESPLVLQLHAELTRLLRERAVLAGASLTGAGRLDGRASL